VILAAGRGGRLSKVTGDLPKCLARVGAMTLLERQIASLCAAGIDEIVVVGGHRIDDVRRVCGPRVQLVENPDYATTNSLYSFWMARRVVTGNLVVLNCDVLFHPQLLSDLLTARYDAALLMCARGDDRYTDEEMKVRVRAGRVVEISKTIEVDSSDGENVGIVKFDAAGTRVLLEEVDRLVPTGRDAWFPAALEAFSRRRPLFVVETRAFPWIEIDCPEDYWRACTQVLPLVDAAAATGYQGTPDHLRPSGLPKATLGGLLYRKRPAR
jgi:choline kinase